MIPTWSQASLSSIPADSIGVGLAVRSHHKGECGQNTRSKNALVALLKLPSPPLETPGDREAWSILVKIMDYSEHQGSLPSSVCCLYYSASPRHCINEILSAIYFPRLFFLYLFSLWTVPHPSQTNCKAKFSVSQH